jgi:hypothetical protein
MRNAQWIGSPLSQDFWPFSESAPINWESVMQQNRGAPWRTRGRSGGFQSSHYF